MTGSSSSVGIEGLIEVVQQLSLARDLPTVQDIVRRAARRLTGADGATFVLRDGDRCHYADEDAIAPLWKGGRFPVSACISGWVMLNRVPAVIEDIYADDRIPHDVYRKTFVKSLVLVPIRTLDPVGAIGNYWAKPHQPTETEVKLLQALADTTAVALENVRVFTELEERVNARTTELQETNRRLEQTNRELQEAHQQADRVFQAYARALPGTVLDGKYRLDEELGTGGFGVVFRSHHLVLDQPIAVKVFRPVPGNDSSLGLQRFLREGAAASRLSHPNAVRVFDSGVSSEGIAYLTMELLRGRSLAEELEERGPLPLRRCAMISRRIAEVLAAAHREGIIHRDIKPENVFLHHDGRETVKVVDFGIARFFGDAGRTGINRLTMTGELVGTPNFLAPERILNEADDGRSDVFSLGVMLYRMICDSQPWSGADQMQLSLGLPMHHPPRPMSGFRKGVPAELETLVQTTLAWKPEDRPIAAELASHLADLLDRLDDEPADMTRQPAKPESERPPEAAMSVAGSYDEPVWDEAGDGD